ncbi:UbiA prenyltransferase family [Irpex lacteus]|nr:UbiA prenyltransferase family [Irpex lacteus]
MSLSEKLPSAIYTPADKAESAWWAYFRLSRLHKFPAGTTVFVAPCAWGLLMGAYNVKAQSIMETLIIGALWYLGNITGHAAACVWNDICDRDVDRLVERSKSRPLAAGTVPLHGAIFLLAALTAATIYLLSRATLATFTIGSLSILLFHVPYPFMKRWTYWPQAWLGLTLSWGAVMGWYSIAGTARSVQVLGPLYCGNTCWTIIYDTIYGCQDRADDLKAGVKSTSVLFGPHTRTALALFAAIFMACLVTAGITNEQGPWYFFLSVGGAFCHLSWQLYTVDLDDPADCWKKFVSNGDIAYIISAGMLFDYVQLLLR